MKWFFFFAVFFLSGNLIAQTDTARPVEKEDVYEFVEIAPEFPGGEKAMFQFITSNLHYPAPCKEEEIQGKVFVQFIIEKDGSVNEVTVVRGVHSALDAEAVRVIKMMPKWKPGYQNGKAVRTRYRLPIYFKLS